MYANSLSGFLYSAQSSTCFHPGPKAALPFSGVSDRSATCVGTKICFTGCYVVILPPTQLPKAPRGYWLSVPMGWCLDTLYLCPIDHGCGFTWSSTGEGSAFQIPWPLATFSSLSSLAPVPWAQFLGPSWPGCLLPQNQPRGVFLKEGHRLLM